MISTCSMWFCSNTTCFALWCKIIAFFSELARLSVPDRATPGHRAAHHLCRSPRGPRGFCCRCLSSADRTGFSVSALGHGSVDPWPLPFVSVAVLVDAAPRCLAVIYSAALWSFAGKQYMTQKGPSLRFFAARSA